MLIFALTSLILWLCPAAYKFTSLPKNLAVKLSFNWSKEIVGKLTSIFLEVPSKETSGVPDGLTGIVWEFILVPLKLKVPEREAEAGVLVNTKDSSFSLNEADKLSNSTDEELALVSASITPSGVYSGKVIEYVGRVRFTVPAGV